MKSVFLGCLCNFEHIYSVCIADMRLELSLLFIGFTCKWLIIWFPLVAASWLDYKALTIEDMIEQPHHPPPVSLRQYLTLSPPLTAKVGIHIYVPV